MDEKRLEIALSRLQRTLHEKIVKNHQFDQLIENKHEELRKLLARAPNKVKLAALIVKSAKLQEEKAINAETIQQLKLETDELTQKVNEQDELIAILLSQVSELKVHKEKTLHELHSSYEDLQDFYNLHEEVYQMMTEEYRTLTYERTNDQQAPTYKQQKALQELADEIRIYEGK